MTCWKDVKLYQNDWHIEKHIAICQLADWTRDPSCFDQSSVARPDLPNCPGTRVETHGCSKWSPNPFPALKQLPMPIFTTDPAIYGAHLFGQGYIHIHVFMIYDMWHSAYIQQVSVFLPQGNCLQRNQLKFRNFVKKLSLPVGHSSFKSMEWKNGVFFLFGWKSWDAEPCRWGFVSIISATQFVEQIMIRCSRFWIFDDECLFVRFNKHNETAHCCRLIWVSKTWPIIDLLTGFDGYQFLQDLVVKI